MYVRGTADLEGGRFLRWDQRNHTSPLKADGLLLLVAEESLRGMSLEVGPLWLAGAGGAQCLKAESDLWLRAADGTSVLKLQGLTQWKRESPELLVIVTAS